MDKITEVKGTITLADGTISEFLIGTDGNWQQWGAVTTERLGRTVDALDAMARALMEDCLLASDSDSDPEPTSCNNCGERIEPDDGGAIWYHAETMSGFCDPEGEERRDRTAEPATKEGGQ